MSETKSNMSTLSLPRKIALQRLGLLWEKLWALTFWLLITAGIVVAVILSGALATLPMALRFSVLGALGLALLASLWPLRKLRVPSEIDALRRMEAEQGVAHRGLSSSSEAVVPELTDELTRALWAEHKRRQLQQAANATISLPRSDWRNFDPRALRVPVLMALLAAIVLGRGSLVGNLQTAANLVTPVVAQPTLIIDAWLKPPAYTGKPPVLITSPAMVQKLADGQALQVPENSVLNLRVTGAVKPVLQITAGGQAQKIKTLASDTAYVAEGTFTTDSKVVVTDGGRDIAQWSIVVNPDLPPTIKVAGEPSPEKSGALSVPWETGDDYGVTGIASEVALADAQDGGIGFANNGPFLYEAPKFPVVLKHANAKSEKGKSTQDLTAHPWAGFNVELTLTAKDAAGHVTQTKAVAFKLPEKLFVRPIARAIIEQRKALILDPEAAPDVAEMFDTLLLYPDGLFDRSAHVLRLAGLSSRLRNASGNGDVKSVVDDLWTLAVQLEDGNFADAKAELAALKKQLEEALRNGASEQEIAKLMDKMRDAMDRYLKSLAQENQKRGNQQANRGSSKEVSKDDLQKMLDQIEKLSKNGSKDMAQNLLDELDRMLQNLQPGHNQQAGQDGQGIGEMMDQLSDMMKEQQRLMDETQRMQGGQQPGEGEGQNPQGGGQDPNGSGTQPGGLADRQGALGDLLDRMQKQLGGNAPGEFGDAQRQMKDAAGSLRDGDSGSALQQQSDALDALRKGAQSLSKQMREKGQGQARNRGRNGEATGRDDDPLGRPRATRNPDQGPDKDMVPSDLAMRKAREILEQLRAKANSEGLTEQERGYIDRLLRGLY
jgi:uncharacterized protein (TIGR02302 family)